MATETVEDRWGTVIVTHPYGDDTVTIIQTGDPVLINIDTMPALIRTLKDAYLEQGTFSAPKKRTAPAKRK